MRRLLASLSVLVLTEVANLAGETIYLPAAASVVGLAPFFSDVRVFNTSYTATRTVTAEYRCFIGVCSSAPQILTLGPRQSLAFDDVCVSLFASPDSAGAVEFTHGGSDGEVVITSRLYSTAPAPTVGMFVPGLPVGSAHPVTALTSVRNGGSGGGFRTNVGVYNPGPAAVTPTFQVYDGSTLVGMTQLPLPLAPRSGAQLNDIFARVGASSTATANASVVVDSGGSQGLFSYAAVIDNATTDPIFVSAAPDQPAPVPTPSPTPGPLRIVNVGQQGLQFIDQVSGGNVSTISVGTTIRWVWVGGGHTSTSGPCNDVTCTADGRWSSPEISEGTFEHTFVEAGMFPYFCAPHSEVMRGTVIVNP